MNLGDWSLPNFIVFDFAFHCRNTTEMLIGNLLDRGASFKLKVEYVTLESSIRTKGII